MLGQSAMEIGSRSSECWQHALLSLSPSVYLCEIKGTKDQDFSCSFSDSLSICVALSVFLLLFVSVPLHSLQLLPLSLSLTLSLSIVLLCQFPRDKPDTQVPLNDLRAPTADAGGFGSCLSTPSCAHDNYVLRAMFDFMRIILFLVCRSFLCVG